MEWELVAGWRWASGREQEVVVDGNMAGRSIMKI